MKKIIIFCYVIFLQSCAFVPQKLSSNVQLPVEFKKVGYRDHYWEIGFDHFAPLTIYKDRVVLKDDDVDMTILFDSIKTIKYENPYHIELKNYIVIDYVEGRMDKKAYFTSMKNMGWTFSTARIYQYLVYAYENRKN